MTAARIGVHTAWTAIMLLSVGVAGYAAFHVATGFVHLGLENDFPSPLGLQAHIIASIFALALGPFQFLRALRTRRPKLHRWLGRVYVAACLAGGVSGAAIAFYSASGPVASAGFLGLAIGWLLTTSLAWRSALQRDFAAHERWMIRSFALTLAAVTLRIYLGLAVATGPGGFPLEAYRIIAWACWIPNLVVAELFIATMRGPKRRRPARPSVKTSTGAA